MPELRSGSKVEQPLAIKPKLIITRPETDSLALAGKLRDCGHEVIIAPLLEIKARSGVRIPAQKFQAVLITSANGLRCLVGPIDTSLPVISLGEQSAAAARLRGFSSVDIKGGNAHALAHYVATNLSPEDGALLYISGAVTSGNLEGRLADEGFCVTRIITYDAVGLRIDRLRHEITPGLAVLLYSQRTAQLWIAEISRLKLDAIAAKIRHLCLSQQVAAALPPEFPAMAAATPDEPGMMALLDLVSKAE